MDKVVELLDRTYRFAIAAMTIVTAGCTAGFIVASVVTVIPTLWASLDDTGGWAEIDRANEDLALAWKLMATASMCLLGHVWVRCLDKAYPIPVDGACELQCRQRATPGATNVR